MRAWRISLIRCICLARIVARWDAGDCVAPIEVAAREILAIPVFSIVAPAGYNNPIVELLHARQSLTDLPASVR